VPLGWRSWQGFAGNPETYSAYNATTFNVTFDADGTTRSGPGEDAEVRHDGVHQVKPSGLSERAHAKHCRPQGWAMLLYMLLSVGTGRFGCSTSAIPPTPALTVEA